MKISALEQAIGRLHLCRRALDNLEDTNRSMKTAIAHMAVFHTHWLDFLVQWKGTYMKVQQAAKDTPQEIQWFGDLNNERRSDHLLRWLYEARNDGEHGGNPSVKHSADTYRLVGPGPDGPTELSIRVAAGGGFEAVSSDGRIFPNAMVFEPGALAVQEVTERDRNRKVPPPASHLGKPIDPKPLTCAQLGYHWIAEVVQIANAMSRP